MGAVRLLVSISFLTATAGAGAAELSAEACKTALVQYVEVAGLKVLPEDKAEAIQRVDPVVDRLVEIVKAPYGSLPAISTRATASWAELTRPAADTHWRASSHA